MVHQELRVRQELQWMAHLEQAELLVKRVHQELLVLLVHQDKTEHQEQMVLRAQAVKMVHQG